MYRTPKFFDSLFSKVLIWSIQLRCSSTKIPRNLIKDDCFISSSFIFKAGYRRGRLSLSWGLWKSINLVLSSFKDNLFARNHSDIFRSSKLKSFIWRIKRSGPKTDPCGKPHIIISNSSVCSKLLFIFSLLLLLLLLLIPLLLLLLSYWIYWFRLVR